MPKSSFGNYCFCKIAGNGNHNNDGDNYEKNENTSLDLYLINAILCLGL